MGGEWRIVAGCRNYTLEAALAHWAADANRFDGVDAGEQNRFVTALIEKLEQ